jgi:hypothetical protein
MTRQQPLFALKSVWLWCVELAMGHPWAIPGLAIALVLLFVRRWTPVDFEDRIPVRRAFHAPDLERFQGVTPRVRRDLDA